MSYKKLAELRKKVNIPKTLYNKFGNFYYRSAESILEAVKPICDELNVSIMISDNIKIIGDRHYIEAKATFVDNDSNISDAGISTFAYAREEPSKKGMDASQITGSASSYARKYALNALLLLDDNKDADHPIAEAEKKSPQTEQKEPEQKKESSVPGDKYDFLKWMKQRKGEIMTITGTCDIYYSILGQFGYEKSNEVDSKDFKAIATAISKAVKIARTFNSKEGNKN